MLLKDGSGWWADISETQLFMKNTPSLRDCETEGLETIVRGVE